MGVGVQAGAAVTKVIFNRSWMGFPHRTIRGGLVIVVHRLPQLPRSHHAIKEYEK